MRCGGWSLQSTSPPGGRGAGRRGRIVVLHGAQDETTWFLEPVLLDTSSPEFNTLDVSTVPLDRQTLEVQNRVGVFALAVAFFVTCTFIPRNPYKTHPPRKTGFEQKVAAHTKESILRAMEIFISRRALMVSTIPAQLRSFQVDCASDYSSIPPHLQISHNLV